MSYITALGTATPPNKFKQSELAAFMTLAMQPDRETERKLNTVFKASGIEYRHSVLKDYGRKNNFDFYNEAFEPFPSTEARSKKFKESALPLCLSAIDQAVSSDAISKTTFTHLITVCCTGMYAPGLDIDLVNHLQLPTAIERTSINFMGCYAAFNALKLADAFCQANARAKVLIVCVELCSLHFQKECTDDNLLANALFADGAAALVVEAQPRAPLRLKLAQFHNDLAPQGANDMAWSIGNFGFEMKLTSYVPEIIQSGIKKLTDSLLQKISKNISDIHFFAIHPGGKKILEAIERELGISKEQNTWAYQVLKNYGNMSSPTVLFVLHEIWQQLSAPDDQKHILSFAFGPGLTLESMVLKIEYDA
jgi:predicted naringenin-chalcone synthase